MTTYPRDIRDCLMHAMRRTIRMVMMWKVRYTRIEPYLTHLKYTLKFLISLFFSLQNFSLQISLYLMSTYSIRVLLRSVLFSL